MKQNRIARVFVRRTNATPDDNLAFVGLPPKLLPPAVDEVHISVVFTWDIPAAQRLADEWAHVAPVQLGGPAMGTRGEEFNPGLYVKQGYTITSRGCPNRCLAGSTPIETTEGTFPIRDLVGKQPMVLSRDAAGSVVFVEASIVAQTGRNERLVRVSFDSGDYIDCTPDHLLKVFLNGNQTTPVREYDTRADRLKPGDSVVAYHKGTRPDGYIEISYGRRKRALLHRMIMSGLLGRELARDEYVHHKDGMKDHNATGNLELVDPATHASKHPEIAGRMRTSNPTLHMTAEWRAKLGRAALGSKRTAEQRERYRLSKLGAKNPNYRGGASVNHKVVRVEALPDLADTYCMEVPGHDWFFANGVLVHNCWFCSVWRREGDTVRELPIRDGWNVLDDNLLACSESHIRAVFAMLERQKGPVEFTGGLEAARLKDWHVDLLHDLKPHQMFFAYDTPDDYEPLVEAGKKLLRVFTLASHVLRAYVFIGYPRDTLDDADRRLRDCYRAGFLPMAMLWRDQHGRTAYEWRRFQKAWARAASVNRMCRDGVTWQQVLSSRKTRSAELSLFPAV